MCAPWLPFVTSLLLMAPAGEAPISDFALRDTTGSIRKLSDCKECRALVVVFIGVECPLARLYAGRLAELAKEFSEKGVAFIAIDSNQHDSREMVADFAKELAVPFPVLLDVGNRVADRFGARRTPEAFVLDTLRTIRYRGRIDDQYGVGVRL